MSRSVAMDAKMSSRPARLAMVNDRVNDFYEHCILKCQNIYANITSLGDPSDINSKQKVARLR